MTELKTLRRVKPGFQRSRVTPKLLAAFVRTNGRRLVSLYVSRAVAA